MGNEPRSKGNEPVRKGEGQTDPRGSFFSLEWTGVEDEQKRPPGAGEGARTEQQVPRFACVSDASSSGKRTCTGDSIGVHAWHVATKQSHHSMGLRLDPYAGRVRYGPMIYSEGICIDHTMSTVFDVDLVAKIETRVHLGILSTRSKTSGSRPRSK